MRSRFVPLLALILTTGLLASQAIGVTAEYGPESEDGWPINVDGEVVKPPVEPQRLLHAPDPLNKLGPATLYPYYPILSAEMIRLADAHPELVRLTSAGKSVAGLDIWMLEIADFDNPDRIPLEDREVVLIDGGVHSNEYSGVYFVTELAQFLIEEYEENETAKFTVENRHTFIIPMVNPDGSNAFGRVNAHWVNINRNFPYTWGETNEDPVFNNPGEEPASEPETRLLIDIYDRLHPDYYASVHCCGNLWLHPWGAEHLADPADMEMFSRTCDELFADIRDRCGPIWSTIYPASGSTVDEAYGRVGTAAWGFEMSGRGNVGLWGQPATLDEVRDQERESWGAVMHAFENVEKYGAHPRIVAVEGSHDELEVTLENIGWGPLVAGNLTLGDTRVALPEIAPAPQNESSPSNVATFSVQGEFDEGIHPVTLDWTKRIYTATQGEKSQRLTLVEESGRLVGTLDDSAQEPNGALDEQGTIPLPWIAFVLLVTGGLAWVRRRQADSR